MNELYVQKLIRLIERGVITIEQIQDPVYKAEIKSRLT